MLIFSLLESFFFFFIKVFGRHSNEANRGFSIVSDPSKPLSTTSMLLYDAWKQDCSCNTPSRDTY